MRDVELAQLGLARGAAAAGAKVERGGAADGVGDHSDLVLVDEVLRIPLDALQLEEDLVGGGLRGRRHTCGSGRAWAGRARRSAAGRRPQGEAPSCRQVSSARGAQAHCMQQASPGRAAGQARCCPIKPAVPPGGPTGAASSARSVRQRVARRMAGVEAGLQVGGQVGRKVGALRQRQEPP